MSRVGPPACFPTIKIEDLVVDTERPVESIAVTITSYIPDIRVPPAKTTPDVAPQVPLAVVPEVRVSENEPEDVPTSETVIELEFRINVTLAEVTATLSVIGTLTLKL